MKIVRYNTFNNDIVFCDGHPHSGKSLLSRILEGFESVEKTKEDEAFTITQELYRVGNIDDNAAIVLFKIWADRYMYNQMIGRNINMRFKDVTSLYKYPFPEKYVSRMCGKERLDVIDRIEKEKPIFHQMTQNSIIYSDLYFKAFGNKLKLIYINRDINDTVKDIMKVGFGERIGTDPTDMGIAVYHTDDIAIPLYAKDWSEEYLSMTPEERIYRWLEQETKLVNEAYTNSKFKDNILFIEFDNLINNPYQELEKIGKLINRKQSDRLPSILARERCPR